MTLSRRQIIQLGLLGLGGAAVPGLAACSSAPAGSSSSSSDGLTLWYWGDGLSDNVVKKATTQFAAQTALTASKIGGDFKQKLTTTIASGKFIPDITGIKGEDMATFKANPGQFLDLNEYGFKDIASKYLDWKIKQGTTTDGKVIGFPIDIGPTGLFYRADVFEKAGLPSDPAKVSAAMATWDGFFEAGVALKKANSSANMVLNAGMVFSSVVGQGTQRFIDENNKFIGGADHIKAAWDLAVKAYTLGIDARTEDGSTDWNTGITKGTLPAVIGAAWHGADIRSGSPDTAGKWRVASAPGGPGNIGGSFLALPKQSKNPKLAFQIMSWILSPENAAEGFTDSSLFPASPSTYTADALTKGDDYFGGQKTIEIFGPAAQKIPIAYEAPADAAVSAPYYSELTNVEQGKKSDEAWASAVSQAKQIAARSGVN